ncbi:hypothetical protein [Limnospira platensis]|jgi:hypothetical protein|uniref:hypothetical protein n=1 Tax=Limnospira platensis TaxID=118562 RepID=UPI0018EFB2C5|nr:hypothetical protein [Arthrospira platensis NCB002]QQW32207.2 hypothetical protein AP9108_26730 [Arthrospira sp. PCC 9108]
MPCQPSYNFYNNDRGKIVSDLKEIEQAILSLPSHEFEKLKQWFFDLDYQRWDEQIEQDIAEGRLEALAQEAIAEFVSGHCREL